MPAESNITLVRRELVPEIEGRRHTLLDFAIKYLQLFLLVLGLCLFVVMGFSLKNQGWLLYGGLALICLLFTAFFYDNWLTGARVPGAMALTLVTTVAVLFLQQHLISGFAQLGAAVLEQMNTRYEGDYMIPLVTEDPRSVSIFFLLIFVPLTAYLGGVVVYRTDIMLVSLLIFPLVALLLLLSAAPGGMAMFCILLGILSVIASDRVGWRKSLWGEKDSWQWKQNWMRRQKISSASALLVALAGSVLMIPSFVILMPSLSIPLAQTVPFAEAVEGKIAQTIMTRLPDLYGGEMSAPLSTFGGGVADGSLTDTSGYLVSGVEDLHLTITKKPKETIYLRGFIGGSYANNQWLVPEEKVFDSAASNWNTEGDPSVYLYNLPFLRMMYEENEAGKSRTNAQLTVQRLSANDDYTYTPYGCYLNEYYRVVGGDGGVEGQKVQDDIFTFYFRSEMRDTLEEEYFMQNESVLDRLERSYSAFVGEHYTRVPEGFASLQAVCDGLSQKEPSEQDIIGYVQQYLTENYTYSLSLPEMPRGEDAILYFLEESKVGCSPQFASAATMLFRMFDIPARYVVGYAASESLFTVQPDGTYQAVLQSDNAHAWVEVYISGTGWLPVETTPGQMGLVQDIEYFGKDLSETEEPVPETSASAESLPEDRQPVVQEKQTFPFEIIVLVLLSAAMLRLFYVLYRKRVRELGLNRKLPASRRVLQIFGAYFRLLQRAGMPKEVESTSEEFPLWVNKLDPQLGDRVFEHMMFLILESCFGRAVIREVDVVWMRKTYRAAKKRIPKKKKEA